MGQLRDEVMLCCCLLITFLVPHEVVGMRCVIESVEDCMPNEEDRLVDTRNITVGVLANGDWSLVGTAEINLKRMSLISMELTKCASKQEPETCMFFSTVRYKNPCSMLDAKDELWSSFVQNTEPPMKCPMKGSYNFEKSYINSEKEGLPGLEGCYWKVKTEVTVGKKKVGCFTMEISTL